MSRKKTKAQIIEGEEQRKYPQSNLKKTREELSEFCKKYLEKKELFRWFIERYYGTRKYIELWELAEADREDDLRQDLNGIWFELPDHVFNIQNNPPGWGAFVELIDD